MLVEGSCPIHGQLEIAHKLFKFNQVRMEKFTVFMQPMRMVVQQPHVIAYSLIPPTQAGAKQGSPTRAQRQSAIPSVQIFIAQIGVITGQLTTSFLETDMMLMRQV